MRDARPHLRAVIGPSSVAVAAAPATGTPSALAAAPVPRPTTTAPPPASPWPAADAIPPSKPTGLRECIAGSGNAVPFCRHPSAGNVAVSRPTVHTKQPDGTFTEVGRVTGTSPAFPLNGTPCAAA